MIHVSKISVPFPGFTPGTAKQTMSKANLLVASTEALEICVKLCLQGE